MTSRPHTACAKTDIHLQAVAICEQKREFLIGVIAPLIPKQGEKDAFTQAVQGLCALGFHFSVLATGDKHSQTQGFDLMARFPEQCEVLEDHPHNKSHILNRAEVAFFVSAPERKDLQEILSKGIVPIMPYHPDFTDYRPLEESGNAFLYEEGNHWAMVEAVIRAYENYQFSYDWGILVKNVRALAGIGKA